jgi:hypothetical protein
MLTKDEKRALLSEVDRINDDILFRIRPSSEIADALYRRNLLRYTPPARNSFADRNFRAGLIFLGLALTLIVYAIARHYGVL